MPRESKILLIAVLVLGMGAAPLSAQAGSGVPGSYFTHSGFILGGYLSVSFGYPNLPNSIALLSLSDGYGPTVHPAVGPVWLDIYSPAYQDILIYPDANGNVFLQAPVPFDPALVNLPPIYAHGFIASPSLPSPGWSITKTVGVTFDTQDGYRQVGNMTAPRMMHTATSLSRSPEDDETRVLIAGGGTGTMFQPVPTNTLELYNPLKRAFEPGPNMAVARMRHQAVLLQDGRVLLIGGLDTNALGTTVCEIFDPVSNSLVIAAPMTVGRVGHAATLLDDGRVLVTGGLTMWQGTSANLNTQFDSAQASGEIYDPVANSWTAVFTAMSLPRAGHTQTKLQDGRVLIAFGINSGLGATTGAPSFTGASELFDPVTNSFTVTGTTVQAQTSAGSYQPSNVSVLARAFHGASLTPDGGVLVTGGIIRNTALLTTAFTQSTGVIARFDPSTQVWSIPYAQSYATAFHQQATSVFNGQVIGMGGYTSTIDNLIGTPRAWRHNGQVTFDTMDIGTHGLLPNGGALPSGNLTMTRLYDGFTYLVCGGASGLGLVRNTAFLVHEY